MNKEFKRFGTLLVICCMMVGTLAWGLSPNKFAHQQEEQGESIDTFAQAKNRIKEMVSHNKNKPGSPVRLMGTCRTTTMTKVVSEIVRKMAADMQATLQSELEKIKQFLDKFNEYKSSLSADAQAQEERELQTWARSLEQCGMDFNKLVERLKIEGWILRQRLVNSHFKSIMKYMKDELNVCLIHIMEAPRESSQQDYFLDMSQKLTSGLLAADYEKHYIDVTEICQEQVADLLSIEKMARKSKDREAMAAMDEEIQKKKDLLAEETTVGIQKGRLEYEIRKDEKMKEIYNILVPKLVYEWNNGRNITEEEILGSNKTTTTDGETLLQEEGEEITCLECS